MKNLFHIFLVASLVGAVSPLKAQDDPVDQLNDYMNAVNLQLESDGASYRVAMAEALTSNDGEYMGITVIAKDVGNKQLDYDFVPGDARRVWSSAGGNSITYAIDMTGDAVPPFGGLTTAETTAAILRATDTWGAVRCSDLGLTQNPDFGIDIGVVAYILSLGGSGSPFVFADIQHAGWGDIDFGGGVLAATFTFVWDNVAGVTDIDNNGKGDTAFREIYYDPGFPWADDGIADVDVESVALHEIGHGLSQAHFGTISIKKGLFSAKPRAVMNSFYSAPFTELQGTDIGGHCSNWAEWPNN